MTMVRKSLIKRGENTRAVTVAIHVVPSVAHFTVPS